MPKIADIAYNTLASAKGAADRAGLFNVRFERRAGKHHISHGSLSPDGADIVNNEQVVTPDAAKAERSATPPVAKEKPRGVVHIVRDFVRANPDMPKAEVVAHLVEKHGINKATAGIQFMKVKRGDV